MSYLVDRGYKVTFEKNMKAWQDLSRMTNKMTGAMTSFRREINVWVLDAHVQIEDSSGDNNQDFRRRG